MSSVREDCRMPYLHATSGGVMVALALLIAACAPAAVGPSGSSAPSPSQVQAAPAHKQLTIGITASVPAISIAGGASPVGGWVAMTELHTGGLITADEQALKPIGRLAETYPTLDDGSIALLPDGQEQVTFHLRPAITCALGVHGGSYGGLGFDTFTVPTSPDEPIVACSVCVPLEWEALGPL